MKLLPLSLLVVVFCAGVKTAHAQDPEFTQFYSNPLYLNPAFAGSHRCPRVALNYRNQWPLLSGTFVTYSATYDQGVPALKGGLGLIVMNDRQAASTLNTTRISGIYAVQVPINRKFSLRAGFEATYFQRSLDWSSLTFGDMIDPRRGFVFQTSDVPRDGGAQGLDLSAGLLGFSESFYVGVAAHHLNEPDETLINNDDARLPMKLTGHVGAVIPLTQSEYTEGATLSPNILYRRQGSAQQLNLGMYITKGVLTGGIWYRNRDAFILMFGVKNEQFQFGYSYDLTISKLGIASGGAHELSMMFNFDCEPRKRPVRRISCPSF